MSGNTPQMGETVSNTDVEYKVFPRLYIEGRAIAVDLSECEGIRKMATVERPHMTLLYRDSGHNEKDLQWARAVVEEWMEYRHLVTVSFTLAPWDSRSKLIKGMLEQLGKHVRELCGTYQNRPLHVELHKFSN